jgi:hypothetical protein
MRIKAGRPSVRVIVKSVLNHCNHPSCIHTRVYKDDWDKCLGCAYSGVKEVEVPGL